MGSSCSAQLRQLSTAATFLRHCATTEPSALRPGHRGFAPPGLGAPGTAGPGQGPPRSRPPSKPGSRPAAGPRRHFGALEPPGAPRALPLSREWFVPPLAARPPPPQPPWAVPAALAPPRGRTAALPPRGGATGGHAPCRCPMARGGRPLPPRGWGVPSPPPCSARWAAPTAPGARGWGGPFVSRGGGERAQRAPGGAGRAAGGGAALWGEEPAPGPWLPCGCLRVTVYTA